MTPLTRPSLGRGKHSSRTTRYQTPAKIYFRNLPPEPLHIFIDEFGDRKLAHPTHHSFGFAGLVVPASLVDECVRLPWIEARGRLGKKPGQRLHAIQAARKHRWGVSVGPALDDFFSDSYFGRLAVMMTSKRPTGGDRLNMATQALGLAIRQVIQHMQPTSLIVTFEEAANLKGKIEPLMQRIGFLMDGRELPVQYRWLGKAEGELALEVADFITYAAGMQARRGETDYIQSYEAVFDVNMPISAQFHETSWLHRDPGGIYKFVNTQPQEYQ